RLGDVTRLQALFDKKNIVISEDAIREILRLDDAEGVVCLPNKEIFAGLAQMGYEKLSTKLIFYKAFFSSQWKFLIHTILQSLSAKRTSWNEFSTAMASAVFANMRRVRKGCSGVETSLFENMLHVREVDAEEEVQVPAHDDVDQENVTEEIDDDVAQPTLLLPPSPQVLDKCSALVLRVEGLESANTAQQLEILKLKAKVKKLERLNKGRISVDIDEGIELVDDQVKGRQADTQAKIYNIDLDHTSKVVPAVVAISAAKPAAKPKVLKIVHAAPTVSTRKRKGVVIRDPKEELHDDTPAKTLSNKDKGKGILVEDPKPMKKKDQIA
nr:hypothetical protein [Tanacetum cinerariifolium]